MLFDTGGGLTIVSPQVAKELGCSPSGRIVGFRMGGEKVVTQRCPGQPVFQAGAELPQEKLAVFDLAKMLPPSWPMLDGMVSLKILERVPFTLDLSAGRLVLESEETFSRTGSVPATFYGPPYKRCSMQGLLRSSNPGPYPFMLSRIQPCLSPETASPAPHPPEI